MAEYIFNIDEALYDEVTGKMVIKPKVVGKLIRCKDCKHYYFADNRVEAEQCHVCGYWDFEDPKPDGFCSFSERREDA